MSSHNHKTQQLNEKKSLKKKKDTKLSPVKCVEHTRTSTQRGKITLNWSQFLQCHSDITKTLKERKDRKQNLNSKGSDHLKNQRPATSSTKMYQPGTYIYAVPVPIYQPVLVPVPNFSAAVALDCEMVGIGDGRENMLARVSIVDEHNICLYDTFVKAREPVVDYRTHVSGVRPEDLINGRDFRIVQDDVYKIIQGKILIGHGISNDLKVLNLSHPRKYIRDTSKYKRFKDMNKGFTPSLKALAHAILNIGIQNGEHSSVEDACATMNIYLRYKDQWEKDIRTRAFTDLK